MIERSLDEIVETVRKAKDRGKACSLLIGAGCSVKAGIPTAAGFVEIIREEYPQAYDRADPKTYASCMAQLTRSEQRDLITEYIDVAKINWAHICIALLMQAGYVDRVLTTNFDLLVVKAASHLCVYPAVYDFAASQNFQPADIPDQAVFYLHGQYTGFVLMNTKDDLDRHSELLSPVFEDAGQGRLWIVAGYSGENDPVFNHLAKVPNFDNGLYWIGYEDAEPAKHVQEALLDQGKDAFYTRGYDADRFFIELTRKLGIFPPKLVGQPFDQLSMMLEMLTPFPVGDEEAEQDVMMDARTAVQQAAARYEEERSPANRAQAFLMAGKYDDAIALREEYDRDPSQEFADTLSWAYVGEGNALSEQANTADGEEADRLYAEAGEKYEAAVAIKPDMHDAFYNWGVTLSNQAETTEGEEASQLYAEAGDKYQAAVALKPNMHEALYNLGTTLSRQAGTVEGNLADRLYAEAGEKYEAALAIEPEKHQALHNWGVALLGRARTKIGEEAYRLYVQSAEKSRAALAIKPDKNEALSNWGDALSDQADTHEGEEADRLYAEAHEKYEAALAIKPDSPTTLCNWGLSLSRQAMEKKREGADRLYAEACEKYRAALVIDPVRLEALASWGDTLVDQAKTKEREEAGRLNTLADEKFGAALAIKPDRRVLKNWSAALVGQGGASEGEKRDNLLERAEQKGLELESLAPGEGAYNLACVAALKDDEPGARTWLEASKAAGELPAVAHLKKDSDLDSIRDTKWFREFLNGLEDSV